MRIVPILAAGLVLGTLPPTAASAGPAFPHQDNLAGRVAATVEWHPSTRHWDHHFHAHQRSLREHRPTVAEQRIHRMMGRTDFQAHTPARSRSYDRLGRRAGTAYE